MRTPKTPPQEPKNVTCAGLKPGQEWRAGGGCKEQHSKNNKTTEIRGVNGYPLPRYYPGSRNANGSPSGIAWQRMNAIKCFISVLASI